MLTVLSTNDHLHYGVHLALGRVLGLCPCAEDLAAAQYARASWHARTPRQMALVTTGQPRSLPDRVRDALELSAAGLKRIGNVF